MEKVKKGETSAEIREGFPLEELTAEDKFTSLLFYFDFLAIFKSDMNVQILEIPNETIRRLYYDKLRGFKKT
jgi:hypothetical protein